MKNDMLIRQDVIAALALDPALTSVAIGVEVHHGFVKLAGRVNSSALRLSAERVTKAVDGVVGVNLDVEVLPERTT